MDSEQKPHSSRGLRVIIFALIIIGFIAFWQANQNSPVIHLPKVITTSQPGLYEVTHVNDGDTIVVEQAGIKETVRFIGIDTPEVKDPRKPVQCFGPEASAKAKSLLSGQKVRLEPDPLGDNRDKYKRLLRYVYTADGTFVNELMVKEGYAFAYIIFPFSKLEDFKTAMNQAEAEGRGLWGKCQVIVIGQMQTTNNL